MKTTYSNKDAAYQKAVAKHLHCSKKIKAEILHALEGDLAAFMTEHPEATAAQLEQHFGKPADCAKSALASLLADDEHAWEFFQKTNKRNRRITMVLLAICALLLVAILCMILKLAIATGLLF